MEKPKNPLSAFFEKINNSIKEIFQPNFLQWLSQAIIYILVFSTTFFLILKTLRFSFPFIVALLLSLIMQPMVRFLSKRLKLNRGIASSIVLAVIILILLALITLILWRLVSECISFVNSIASYDFQNLIVSIEQKLNSLNLSNIIGNIDIKSIFQEHSSDILKGLQGSVNVASTVLDSFVAAISSLPNIFITITVTLFATFYFSRGWLNVKYNLKKVFKPSIIKRASSVYKEGIVMLVKYLNAYFKLILINFVLTFIIMLILDIKYALLFALLAAVLDIFPIIGSSIVYIPLAIYYYFAGSTFAAIGLIVGLIIVSVVRQVLEPKFISKSIDIHPLIMLTCFFLSIELDNIIVLIYLVALIIVYNLLKRCGFFKKLKS